jgi:hypothetical protein
MAKASDLHTTFGDFNELYLVNWIGECGSLHVYNGLHRRSVNLDVALRGRNGLVARQSLNITQAAAKPTDSPSSGGDKCPSTRMTGTTFKAKR